MKKCGRQVSGCTISGLGCRVEGQLRLAQPEINSQDVHVDL
jgi:hypothetical protein